MPTHTEIMGANRGPHLSREDHLPGRRNGLPTQQKLNEKHSHEGQAPPCVGQLYYTHTHKYVSTFAQYKKNIIYYECVSQLNTLGNIFAIK